MEHRIADYRVEVNIRANDEAASPPDTGDLEQVVRVAVENYLSKQNGGIDHAGIAVRVEAIQL